MFSRLMFRSPRSQLLTYVRSSAASKASASWDNPLAFRSCRRRLPNSALGESCGFFGTAGFWRDAVFESTDFTSLPALRVSPAESEQPTQGAWQSKRICFFAPMVMRSR